MDDAGDKRADHALEGRVSKLEIAVQTLRENVAEIKGVLPTLATKTDVATLAERLSTKIDSSVVALLNNALAAYPARAGATWQAVAAITTIAALGLAVAEIIFKHS